MLAKAELSCVRRVLDVCCDDTHLVSAACICQLAASQLCTATQLDLGKGQLTSPLRPRHTNTSVIHLRSMVSTEAEWRRDVGIATFYWLLNQFTTLASTGYATGLTYFYHMERNASLLSPRFWCSPDLGTLQRILRYFSPQIVLKLRNLSRNSFFLICD